MSDWLSWTAFKTLTFLDCQKNSSLTGVFLFGDILSNNETPNFFKFDETLFSSFKQTKKRLTSENESF